MKDWLARTADGKFKIEKIPCPNIGQKVVMSRPAAGVLHTTEGGWDSAMSVFRRHYAPTFLVGKKRIAQLIPLGIMGSTLENSSGGDDTNRWARVQIETVGFSKDKPYVFDVGTMDALASLLATLKVEAKIPLTRPYPDKMPGLPWATTNFVRRRDGRWGDVSGWFGHVEIPENKHWDPGALKWTQLLTQARKRLPGNEPPDPDAPWYENLPGPRPKPDWFWDALEVADKRRKEL
jgi:hypothetical protein